MRRSLVSTTTSLMRVRRRSSERSADAPPVPIWASAMFKSRPECVYIDSGSCGADRRPMTLAASSSSWSRVISARCHSSCCASSDVFCTAARGAGARNMKKMKSMFAADVKFRRSSTEKPACLVLTALKNAALKRVSNLRGSSEEPSSL